MYYFKILELIKEDIKLDLDDLNGDIRVLVVISVVGMGVNFKGVYYVINYGFLKDMDVFVQQFGRVGWDGKILMVLFLFNGRQCQKLDSDMKNYIINIDKCRRECLLNVYNFKLFLCVKYLCCDICDKLCNCNNNCLDFQYFYFEFVLLDVFMFFDEFDCFDFDDLII